MPEKEWMQLAQQGGGQFLDLVSCYRKSPTGKMQKRTRREVGQALAVSLSAMANADGGTVLLGAEMDGEFSGIFFEDRERHFLIHALESSAVPPLKFQVTPEEVEGKTLLRFTVFPSPAVHLLKNGKCFLRVGSQNISLSRERMSVLKESRWETWHEREVLPKSSLTDLDETLVEEFIHQQNISGEAEKILYRPYGLIEYRQGQPLLTRAAAYLFGKDPLRWHPRPGIDFVRFEGTEKGKGSEYNVVERVRMEAPILRLIGEMERVIGGRLQERVLLRDLFFREKFAYPFFAWREALINAIAHRDYSLEGSAVEVRLFDDRIEVWSPGKLPGVLRIQQLLRQQRVHYSRNPLITRVLTDGGFMRALGEGLPMIFQEMERNGLNPPQLQEEGNFCRLIIRNTPIFDESTLAWLHQFSGQDLNARQKRILTYAQAHGMIFSSSDYQKLGVDRDTAYTEIKDLVKRGIVEPFKKHGRVYRVLGFEDRTASLPGLNWVMPAIEKKGFFTFRDLQQPQSVSRGKALDMMRELARQGYFTPSGKGRATRYYPTEKLNSLLKKDKENEG
ncbi:MAG: putative DNA binding domain-containing protein [Deltaproteobacteria bacterium]|nr:putative DNA binding domain-containing protein [Deltaproteobacteria bacterium]